MAFEFKFPDVGEGVHEGELLKWLVKVGDAVEEHQALAEIHTDKAVVEVPSPKKGIILKLHFKHGDKINVGDVLVTIGVKEEAIQKAAVSKPAKLQKSETKSVSVMGELEEAPPEEEEEKVELPSRKVSENILALPSVRKLARDLGIDLSGINGTGHKGRITESDVRSASPEKPVSKTTTIEQGVKVTFDDYGSVLRIPLHGTRKAIAEHMAKSHQHAVLVTHIDEADVTKLFEIREREKAEAEKKGIHLTYLPFMIKAVVAALKANPYVNSSMDEETNTILLKKYFNIGFAVDTIDGLLVPVIKNADKRGILEIAKELNDLAEKARNKEISLKEMQGGTFTITNIGSIGGTAFTPIPNYPESSILGIGKMIDKPVVKEHKIVIRKILPLVISFDHRIIDGAKIAKFMNHIIKHLEDPNLLWIETG